jgi:hypothetical protein
MAKQNSFGKYKKRVKKDAKSIHQKLWSWGEGITSRQTGWRKPTYTIVGVGLYCCITPFLVVISMCFRSAQAGVEDGSKRISKF